MNFEAFAGFLMYQGKGHFPHVSDLTLGGLRYKEINYDRRMYLWKMHRKHYAAIRAWTIQLAEIEQLELQIKQGMEFSQLKPLFQHLVKKYYKPLVVEMVHWILVEGFVPIEPVICETGHIVFRIPPPETVRVYVVYDPLQSKKSYVCARVADFMEGSDLVERLGGIKDPNADKNEKHEDKEAKRSAMRCFYTMRLDAGMCLKYGIDKIKNNNGQSAGREVTSVPENNNSNDDTSNLIIDDTVTFLTGFGYDPSVNGEIISIVNSWVEELEVHTMRENEYHQQLKASKKPLILTHTEVKFDPISGDIKNMNQMTNIGATTSADVQLMGRMRHDANFAANRTGNAGQSLLESSMINTNQKNSSTSSGKGGSINPDTIPEDASSGGKTFDDSAGDPSRSNVQKYLSGLGLRGKAYGELGIFPLGMNEKVTQIVQVPPPPDFTPNEARIEEIISSAYLIPISSFKQSSGVTKGDTESLKETKNIFITKIARHISESLSMLLQVSSASMRDELKAFSMMRYYEPYMRKRLQRERGQYLRTVCEVTGADVSIVDPSANAASKKDKKNEIEAEEVGESRQDVEGAIETAKEGLKSAVVSESSSSSEIKSKSGKKSKKRHHDQVVPYAGSISDVDGQKDFKRRLISRGGKKQKGFIPYPQIFDIEEEETPSERLARADYRLRQVMQDAIDYNRETNQLLYFVETAIGSEILSFLSKTHKTETKWIFEGVNAISKRAEQEASQPLSIELRSNLQEKSDDLGDLIYNFMFVRSLNGEDLIRRAQSSLEIPETMDRVANNQIQAQKLDEFRDQWWESLSTGLKAGNVLTEIESLVAQVSGGGGGGGGKSGKGSGEGGGKGGNGKSILKTISAMANGGFDKAKKDEEDKIKEKEKKEKEAQAKAKSGS